MEIYEVLKNLTCDHEKLDLESACNECRNQAALQFFRTKGKGYIVPEPPKPFGQSNEGHSCPQCKEELKETLN